MPVSRGDVITGLGGKCTDCQGSEELELHYAPGNDQRYGANMYRKLRAAIREPEKFVVRCAGCRVLAARNGRHADGTIVKDDEVYRGE